MLDAEFRSLRLRGSIFAICGGGRHNPALIGK
jgi:hypothetical protein